MFRRFLRHKVIRDKGLLLIFPKPPLFPRLLLGTFVGNVNIGHALSPGIYRRVGMPARSSASRRQGAYRYLRPPVFPGRWCVAEALLGYGEGPGMSPRARPACPESPSDHRLDRAGKQ